VQRIVEYFGLFEHAVGQLFGGTESWPDPVSCPGTEAAYTRLHAEVGEQAGVDDGVESVEPGADADTYEVEVVEVLHTTLDGPGRAVAAVGST
jgi:hypothetical protein